MLGAARYQAMAQSSRGKKAPTAKSNSNTRGKSASSASRSSSANRASPASRAGSGGGTNAIAGAGNGSGARGGSSSSVTNSAYAARVARRRGIAAAVFFILAVFSFIGYWNTDGAFIGFFVGLVRNLIGHGFYAVPPVLLVCAVILTFHRGKPVRFRVISAICLSIMAGALMHLFTCDLRDDLSFGMFPELWESGAQLLSGGAISGALAEVFHWLFGKIGAAVVLIISTLFLLLTTFNRTISGIVDAIRNRERREYYPEPEFETEPEREPFAEQRPRPAPKAATPPKKRRGIDIPLDHEAPEPRRNPFMAQPRTGFFKGASNVKTPDQLISEYAPETEEPEPDDTGEVEDMELDIPFMERKRSRAAAGKPKPDPGKSPASEASAAADETGTAPESAAGPSEIGADGKEKAQPELIEPLKTAPDAVYTFPPVDLLSVGERRSRAGDDEVRINSERLEAAFQSFGVNVNISNATRGPTVTRYEAELEAGIKLSKLTSLADDIALSLGASGVRIAAMPNKISTVGIEVPNKSISRVHLRDILESQAFSGAKSKLTFAIGMNIAGDAIVGNVSKLPHLLVAGTTGSGKSVCLNSFILSILYKATPEDVRFIMIDPKMVEFKVYNEIPHLLVPVVTDIKKAAGALQWAVFQMMKRYALFADTDVRDIDGYNQFARKSKTLETLPQIIVVIDELADLMMMAAKDVEESVCRVAQMGRAAGMHLVIATQSPRADVITGLMKANIPSRIAFKVSSALESRIILDAGGNADKLVGNGDMLYAPTGSDKPTRVQGTWVSDKEREKVVEFIKKSGETQYSVEVMAEIERAAADRSSGEKPADEPESSDHDELLPQAVDLIFETGQASVSMLQRRLKLGFSRAGRIVDQMEQMGIVGPYEGSKPRALLITKDQWRQMQYVSGTAPEDRPFSPPDD